ncbi:MAG: 30S ribosomal protein S6 [Desulfobacterales bacterium]|nr:30S ribosomal protein S6 [Desulfobacterales bacterium]MBS3754113.1 30S ribosomal protein S6 [Desulfobacterales bacterium]
MNRYENITIIDADVGEDDKKALLERIESQITKRNGTLLAFDDWGMRKLAYEIRKKKQGQYVRTDFCGTGEIVDAIEQMLRHDQRVLRFMTVRMEENVDPEALQAGSEEEAGEQESAAETAEPETASAETGAPAAETEESTPASQEEES